MDRPLLASFWRAVRYHMGSLAFGSLLIAIVQLLRIICEYVDAKTKGLQDKNRLVKILIKVPHHCALYLCAVRAISRCCLRLMSLALRSSSGGSGASWQWHPWPFDLRPFVLRCHLAASLAFAIAPGFTCHFVDRWSNVVCGVSRRV